MADPPTADLAELIAQGLALDLAPVHLGLELDAEPDEADDDAT